MNELEPRIGPWESHRGTRSHIAFPGEALLISQSFRAFPWREGCVDPRFKARPSVEDTRWLDQTCPLVMRVDTFGAQGADEGEWNYTARPLGSGSHIGGSANGGIIFLPPEVGMEDRGESLAPGSRTISSSLVLAGPGVSWGAGIPDVTDGSISDGVIWTADASDNLLFTVAKAGVETDAFRIANANARPGWTDGTSFWGDLAHANTKDRTWTFPDRDGTVGIRESQIRTVAFGDSPVTHSSTTDDVILCDCSGGAITINLEAVATADGIPITVKKIDSSTNKVTIDGSGGETIDDATTAVLEDQYESVRLMPDGTEWWIY